MPSLKTTLLNTLFILPLTLASSIPAPHSLNMTTKPTFVIVPGSTAPVSFYSRLVTDLRAHAFDVATVSLASVGVRPGEHATMYDDANAIQGVVSTIADEGKEVVLVMHSYGGIPGTQASRDVSVEKRKEQGKKGGVRHLVYMTAIVPGLGESSESMFGSLLPDHLALRDGYLINVNQSAAALRTINDAPFTLALEATNTMLPHSYKSFQGPATSLGYEVSPVTYIHCSEDMIIPPALQDHFVEKIRNSGREVEVASLPSGHCPNISRPKDTLDILLKVAGSV